MVVPLSSLAVAALTTLVQPQPAASSQDPIIVTGQRLPDYRKALAECLARNCPPDEDIRASTALAETLFFAGDYREARAVLRASIGRNRDKASRFPEPVSDLYRADSRVARHLGLDDDAQRSTREILRSLKAGIPAEDGRHFVARMENAHSLIFFGRLLEAEQALKELAALGRKAGRNDVVMAAEMQKLWIDYKRGNWNPVQRRLLQDSAFGDPQRSIMAKILLIRMYSERGEKKRADDIIAKLGKGGRKRALLFEPEYQLTQYEETMNAERRLLTGPKGPSIAAGPVLIVKSAPASSLADRISDVGEDAWIDVAFKVRADGRVEDVQIVRRGPGSPGWENPLLKAVEGRRYTAADNNQDTLKIERFTYTSRFGAGVDSRISSRSNRARIEKIELSSVDLPGGAGASVKPL